MKKIKKWVADITDFPAFLWYFLPFTAYTTEKLARKNTKKLRRNLAREYRLHKNWYEKFLFYLTENKILWVVFSVISFFLFWHVFPFLQDSTAFFLQENLNFLGNTQKNDADFLILTAQHVIFFLHEVVNFLGDTRKSDANFLIATVQAALAGVIVPIAIAVYNISNSTATPFERYALIKHAKLYGFLWSSVLLLAIVALSESFSCISNAYYFGQYGWFVINLLLFIRVIVVYLYNDDENVALLVKAYAHNIESRIADIIFRRMGDD